MNCSPVVAQFCSAGGGDGAVQLEAFYQVSLIENEWYFQVVDATTLQQTAEYPLPSPEGASYWVSFQDGVQVIQATGDLMEADGYTCSDLAAALLKETTAAEAPQEIPAGSQLPLGQETPNALTGPGAYVGPLPDDNDEAKSVKVILLCRVLLRMLSCGNS